MPRVLVPERLGQRRTWIPAQFGLHSYAPSKKTTKIGILQYPVKKDTVFP